MPRRLLLEDFGHAPEPAGTPQDEFAVPAALEQFEKGYAAGWEDAVAAETEAQQRISADLSSNLRDLSFTYTEAHSHVVAAVESVLRDVVDKLLPEISRETLGPIVAERLKAALHESACAPVHLTVAPGDRERIAAALPADAGFPLEIREQDTLAEGQVYLQAGTIEERVDLSAALSEITSAVAGFFTLHERKVANG